VNFILPVLLFHTALVFVSVFFVLREKNARFASEEIKSALACLGFKRTSAKKIIQQTVILFFALLGLGVLLSILFVLAGVNDLGNVEKAFSQITAFEILCLFVLGGIAEETFFRGFLVPRAGILWSSIVFGLFHIAYFSIAEFVGTVLLGMLLAYFYKKNKTIYPNIIAHQAFNFFVFMMYVV